jgi:hypothetical protein
MEQFDERRHLVVRVQSARTGEHPDLCAFEAFGLSSERRRGPTKSMPVGPEAQKRHDARSVAAYLKRQALSTADEFSGAQLVGTRARAADEVREPVARSEKLVFFRRMQQARRKARPVKRWPKPVSGSGKVVPRGRRVKPRVDAAEEHFEPRRNHVLQVPRPCRLEVGLARPDGGCSRPTFHPAQA